MVGHRDQQRNRERDALRVPEVNGKSCRGVIRTPVPVGSRLAPHPSPPVPSRPRLCPEVATSKLFRGSLRGCEGVCCGTGKCGPGFPPFDPKPALQLPALLSPRSNSCDERSRVSARCPRAACPAPPSFLAVRGLPRLRALQRKWGAETLPGAACEGAGMSTSIEARLSPRRGRSGSNSASGAAHHRAAVLLSPAASRELSAPPRYPLPGR